MTTIYSDVIVFGLSPSLVSKRIKCHRNNKFVYSEVV